MKFLSAALFLASLTNSVGAFSVSTKANGPTVAPVDRTMRTVDSDANTFDPTAGDAPALNRNNNGEVWVPQVR